MLVALTILSTEFWNFNDTEEPSNVTSSTTASPAPQNTVILCALCVYIAGYQVCFGPLTWCIVSEIFPLEIRSQAIALCVGTSYNTNLSYLTLPGRTEMSLCVYLCTSLNNRHCLYLE